MSESHGGMTRRSSWVALTVGVVGGILLLGTATSAAVAGVNASGTSLALAGGADVQHMQNPKKQLLTQDAKGISEIDVDAFAARLSIGCNTALATESGEGESSTGGDADAEFTLVVANGSREWKMERHGDTLKVEPVKRWFEGFRLFGFGRQSMQDLALVLPTSVCSGGNPIDADLHLDVGKLQVDGVFGELELKVNAGDARLDGSASALDVDLNAGEATLNLSDVRVADLSVSAGDLWANFDGTAPKQIEVDVSAGSADLRLPDEVYSVQSKVEIGDFENLLRTDNSSNEHQIEVNLSVGDLRLGVLK